MRIGVDLRVLASGRRTGIEEYTIGLLNELLPLGRQHEWLLFYNASTKPAFSFPWGALSWVRVCARRIPNRPLMLASAYLNAPSVNRFLGPLDLFFAPHFFPIAVRAPTKLVVTFHDLSFVRYPEFLSLKKRWWHALSAPQRQAERADRLITVSASSARDLALLYGIDPAKIAVIHSGVAPDFGPVEATDIRLERIRQKYRLPERFILYLGTIEPRKNIVGLIRAFERLAGQDRETALVIAGAPGWSSRAIYRAWQDSPVRARIHGIGFIPEEEKRYLYNLSRLFVYPSFFEGFGFPVLEAMVCGVPVVASRTSSLPEVVGDAGILVDPRSVGELSWAMHEALTDNALRARLRSAALARAKRFSWRASAQSTMQLFESMVY
ncbi:MAG: glycosyltransferase family 1 protein [bacterium]|nr:glycosyltransferase family 1 protein [bacterium]